MQQGTGIGRYRLLNFLQQLLIVCFFKLNPCHIDLHHCLLIPFSVPFMSLLTLSPRGEHIFPFCNSCVFFRKHFDSYPALNARWRCKLVGKFYPKQRYLKWERGSFQSSKFRGVWLSPLSNMGRMVVHLFTGRFLKILVRGGLGLLLGLKKSARHRILPIKHIRGAKVGQNLQKQHEGQAQEGLLTNFPSRNKYTNNPSIKQQVIKQKTKGLLK